MKIDIQGQDDSIIYKTTQKMFTKVVDTQQKETLKAIEEYHRKGFSELYNRIDQVLIKMNDTFNIMDEIENILIGDDENE